MKLNEEQFNKASKILSEVSLSSTEKKSMLEGIYANEPVTLLKATPSPFSSFSMFFVHQRNLIALATMVLMFTGTAYAATGSLPGDPLYAMKVSVLEPVSLALRFDEAEKNKYKVALLQERIVEIQTLKSKGKINPKNEIASFIATKKNVTALEASAIFDEAGGNIEVSTKIEAYNKLVPEKLKIKSFIKVETDAEVNGNASSTKSKDEEDDTSEVHGVMDDVDNIVIDAFKKEEKVIDKSSETINAPPVNGGSVVPAPVVPNIEL